MFGCYLTAICVKDIGAVISIAGTTCNPFIGFLFPIMFYLRLESIDHAKRQYKDNGFGRAMKRFFAYFVALIITMIGVAGFINLFNKPEAAAAASPSSSGS